MRHLGQVKRPFDHGLRTDVIRYRKRHNAVVMRALLRFGSSFSVADERQHFFERCFVRYKPQPVADNFRQPRDYDGTCDGGRLKPETVHGTVRELIFRNADKLVCVSEPFEFLGRIGGKVRFNSHKGVVVLFSETPDLTCENIFVKAAAQYRNLLALRNGDDLRHKTVRTVAGGIRADDVSFRPLSAFRKRQ